MKDKTWRIVWAVGLGVVLVGFGWAQEIPLSSQALEAEIRALKVEMGDVGTPAQQARLDDLLARYFESIGVRRPEGNGGPPPNDDCTGAILLTCPGGGGTFSVFGSTTSATFDPQGFCGTSHSAPEVWYQIVGNNGLIDVTTCSASTNYDTKITVWDGSCGSLGCVDGDDDDPSCGFSALHSTVSWFSTDATDYFIMVHGFSNDTGDFELTVTCEVPVELQSFTVER